LQGVARVAGLRMYGLNDTAFAVAPIASLPTALEDKRCLIVGGTGGIGRACARLIASSGGYTTVVGRTQRDAEVPRLTFVRADLHSMVEAQRVAASLPCEEFDFIFFAAGTIAGAKKATTAEGVEESLAVSALARFVMLQTMRPRLKASARVFVWGLPGSGFYAQAKLADFNSEDGYAGGFGFTHANTVVLNEAIVHFYAAQGLFIFGLNPGLIKTKIRESLHGGGALGSCLECCLSCCNPSADDYVRRLLPVLLAPALETHTGAMFGQSVLFPSPPPCPLVPTLLKIPSSSPPPTLTPQERQPNSSHTRAHGACNCAMDSQGHCAG
jgi:NAD(P)-dependent dehydrogenase (short-subunit alcohol dehydrogenase family)